jgi:hypothetical protein
MPRNKSITQEDLSRIKKEIDIHFTRIFTGFDEAAMLARNDFSDISEKRNVALKNSIAAINGVFQQAGFVDIKRFGLASVKKYWLLMYVLDLPAARTIRQRYLLEMQRSLKDQSILRPFYARLYDKVALQSGKKQRYGTQPGSEDKAMVEEPETLQDRRIAMGLE